MNFLLASIFFLAPIIQEAIPDGPFFYRGAHPREVILLDPADSPLLEAAYWDLVEQLSSSFSEVQILQVTSLYIREKLFDLTLCNEQSVRRLLEALYPDEKEPEVSLETFLEHKTGVCRHIALTSTYLVDRLIKEGWLQGEARLVRADCIMGRHAWTLFTSPEGSWHLDCLWDVLENGKTGAGFSRLCQKYGRKTINEVLGNSTAIKSH